MPLPEILSTVQLLCGTSPVELRALSPDGRMHVKRFDSAEPAARWGACCDPRAKAVYVVMNPFDPALIRTAAVNDEAVTSRRWFLLDVDPERPKDANSTDAELEAAESTASVVEAYLSRDHGWPAPVRAMSGNGAHRLWRLDLPNDSESDGLVNGALKALAAEFSTPAMSVDTTVGNAARITKLYGTWARKGEPTRERPHRQSQVLHVPTLFPVSRDSLAAVAAMYRQPVVERTEASPKRGEYDLGQVLARLVVRKTFVKDGSTWHVVVCPWAAEHSTDREDEATVVTVGSGGGFGFKCQHSHCADRTWEDLRSRLGLTTKGWQERAQGKANGQPEPSRAVPKPATSRVTIGDVSRREAVLSRMESYANTGKMPGALSTGMRRLDGMLLGGLRPSKFYLLGGESGRGKTTLLMQWAFEIARHVRLVGIVTPEMDLESVDERAYSQLSGFGVSNYRRDPRMGRDNWTAVRIPQNVRASFDPSDTLAFAMEEKPDLLIVDYAQQAVDYESDRRHLALAKLGADCLAVAKANRIPVVLGTQVNVTEEREFKVRETKILEHQADAMLFIDVQYEKLADPNGIRHVKAGAGLIVEKNRHGATGRVPIRWERELFRFYEAEE